MIAVKTQLQHIEADQVKYKILDVKSVIVRVQFSWLESLAIKYNFSVTCKPQCRQADKTRTYIEVEASKPDVYTFYFRAAQGDRQSLLRFLLNTSRTDNSARRHVELNRFIYADAVKFSWAPEATEVSYCVYYQQKNGISSSAQCSLPGATNLLITGLTNKTGFTICVSQAILNTSGNYTCTSQPIITKPSTTGPVTSMAISQIRATGAVVHWNKPVDPDDNPEAYSIIVTKSSHGCIVAYILATESWINNHKQWLKAKMCNRQRVMATLHENSSTFNHTITGLNADEIYEVTIYPPDERRTKVNVSETFRSLPGITEVTIKETHGNALLLSWKKPWSTLRNLTGYFAAAKDNVHGVNCTYVAVVICRGCNYMTASPYFINAVGPNCTLSEMRVMQSDDKEKPEQYYALIQGLHKETKYKVQIGSVDVAGALDVTYEKVHHFRPKQDSGQSVEDAGIPLSVHMFYLPVWVITVLLIVINIVHACWTRQIMKQQAVVDVPPEEFFADNHDPYYDITR